MSRGRTCQNSIASGRSRNPPQWGGLGTGVPSGYLASSSFCLRGDRRVAGRCAVFSIGPCTPKSLACNDPKA